MKHLVFATTLGGAVLIGCAWTGWDWLTGHGFGFWGFLGLIWLDLCLIGGVAVALESVSQRWKPGNIHSEGPTTSRSTGMVIHQPEKDQRQPE